MIFKKEKVEIEIKDLTTRTLGKFLHLSGVTYEMLLNPQEMLKSIFGLVDKCYEAAIELKLIVSIKIDGNIVDFDTFDSEGSNFLYVSEMMIEYINSNLNGQKKTI